MASMEEIFERLATTMTRQLEAQAAQAEQRMAAFEQVIMEQNANCQALFLQWLVIDCLETGL